MGKNIVVFAFVVTLCLAVYTIFTRASLFQESMHVGVNPLVTLEGFTIFRYNKHKVTKTLSGQVGQFFEPNKLELFGRVRGLRHDSDRREYVSAETALVFFNGSGITDIIASPGVSEAEFEDNVHLGVRYNRISTEFAEYLPGQGILQSDVQVLIRGPSGRVEGRNGFRFYEETEDIEVYGPIKGIMQGAVLNGK